MIVSLAYSARHDDDRRALVEGPSTEPGSLLEYYVQTPTLRIVSARQELGATFTRLLRTAEGTAVGFELSPDMLLPVYRGRAIEILEEGPVPAALPAGVALRLAPGASLLDGADTFTIEVDGVQAGAFAAESSLGGLPYASVAWPAGMTWTGSHTLKVTNVGGLGAGDTLEPDRILDILLMMPVKLEA